MKNKKKIKQHQALLYVCFAIIYFFIVNFKLVLVYFYYCLIFGLAI